MRFIKQLNSKFRGRIIYIDDNRVVNYAIGPFTFFLSVAICCFFVTFTFYLLGFRVASSAFLSKKELEIKKIKSINAILTKKLDIAMRDVEIFNNYVYNSSKKRDENAFKDLIVPICNNGEQYSIFNDNPKQLHKTTNGIESKHDQRFERASFSSNYNSNNNIFIETTFDAIKEVSKLDTKILTAREIINNVIKDNLKSIIILEDKSVDKNTILTKVSEESLYIKSSYHKIQNIIDAINNIEEQIKSTNNSSTISNDIIGTMFYQQVYKDNYGNQKVCNVFECKSKNDILERIFILKNLQSKISSLPIGSPIDFIKMSSGYGARIDPQRKTLSFHHGLDLVGIKNEKVSSVSDGVVIAAGQFSGYGNYIEINHGNGIKTGYAHLKKIFVKPGNKVHKGDIIGIQGSTGKSTGDHLHYEVKITNQRKNPITFIKNNSINNA